MIIAKNAEEMQILSNNGPLVMKVRFVAVDVICMYDLNVYVKREITVFA
jgi:hypothetical protein